MTSHSGKTVIASLIGALFIAAVAQAQFPDRRRPVIFPDNISDRRQAASALTRKLELAQDFRKVRGLLQKMLRNPDNYDLDLQKLRDLQKKYGITKPEDLNIDLNDKDLQKLIQQVRRADLKKPADQRAITPEEDKALQRAVNLPPPGDPTGVGGDPGGGPDVPMGGNPDTPPGGNPDTPPDGGNVPNRNGSSSSPNDGEPNPPQPTNWLERRLLGMRDLGEDLARQLDLGTGDWIGGGGFDLDKYTGGLAARAENWLPEIGDLGLEDYADDVARLLPNVTMPSMPDLDVSANGGTFGGSGGPNISSTGTRGVAIGTLLIFLGVAVGVALIVLLAGSTVLLPRKSTDGWHLGPWPVAPNSIRTQSDLIAAFEHLALYCLGREATATNHCEIAAQVAQQHPGSDSHQIAADHLASLYETARYAPPDEALGEAAVVSARRDLCLLAGVAPQ